MRSHCQDLIAHGTSFVEEPHAHACMLVSTQGLHSPVSKENDPKLLTEMQPQISNEETRTGMAEVGTAMSFARKQLVTTRIA
jgi:hypothetical protein